MRTRARRIAVRVTEEQYNKISRLTERSFFTKEQVLRDIILGYPIQEDRKPECMKLILKLRGIASIFNNLCRNYGLSDLPIGKEIKQTADAVEDTENLIEDCIFITRMKRVVIHYNFVGYLEIPENDTPCFTEDTRQGVAIGYIAKPTEKSA